MSDYDSAIQGIAIFNPQHYAVIIEHTGNFPYQAANDIRRDPIGYLDTYILDSLEKASDISRDAVCAFWDKYEKYKGMRMDDIGETTVREIVSDFQKIIKKSKSR